MKYCQGPICHEYKTKDRIRGSKGDKHYETRKRSSFYYLDGNCCSLACMYDWFNVYGSRALNHFGRITEAKVLTADNAWTKRYDWRSRADGGYRHYLYNHLTEERRNITEQQYNNENTITDDGQLNITHLFTS